MSSSKSEIIRRVQVHVPFHRILNELLPLILSEKLNPEISFNHNSLDYGQKSDFQEVARHLQKAALSVTFHAPFLDLRPGALDPLIRQVTIDRLKQVFDLIPCFKPHSVVCHPAFDARYYPTAEKQWLENSIETWQRFIPFVEQTDTIIMLENVYETSPQQLLSLFSLINSPKLRFCFDTGHFNVFSKAPLEEWIEALFPFLGQLHIHDNHGETDEHLPPGEGTFPFPQFFSEIKKKGLDPIITIEAHSEINLRQSLINFKTLGLLDPI